jgi:hypothetical protein
MRMVTVTEMAMEMARNPGSRLGKERRYWRELETIRLLARLGPLGISEIAIPRQAQ